MIDCTKTENYLLEKKRMTKRAKNGQCQLGCSSCPLCRTNNNKGLLCAEFEVLYPKEAIKAVQEWSNANPQRTYLSAFLKNYPNALLTDDGMPTTGCPYRLGLIGIEECKKNRTCIECWNQPIEGGEENG